MRGLSWAAWNEAVLSSSITATMCCRQMSGMSRLSTTSATDGCKPHGHMAHLIGLERLLAADRLDRVSGPWIGEPTVHFLMSVLRDLVALAEFFDEL